MCMAQVAVQPLGVLQQQQAANQRQILQPPRPLALPQPLLPVAPQPLLPVAPVQQVGCICVGGTLQSSKFCRL